MLRILKVIMLSLLFSLTACQMMESKSEQLPAGIKLGETYYTQVTMMYEKGVYRTTNYRRGTLVEVNTPVELLEISPKVIKVKILPKNTELLIKNVAKHTGDDVYQAFAKLFAKQAVNLTRFKLQERGNIKRGTVEKGMSKNAVQVAIGYPPITRTPSLDANQWTYWTSRFDTFIVHFENGKVSRIEDTKPILLPWYL
ncbi:hypothetical protein [methanotrophic endosymbiont of Bathymodiolus puteoserpentis (Logatchev)]|jgi:hypothetical protein|uniref:hypothetical protein n=1 Tax=methanotrophic endosymbiont of Bathymodiolus puteoserpentis (Logatchev) TaxID=343235 RepID=UPI0013CB4FDD|nr:hypothetical protein [methanotrophic endosymbiont of Bathymodiolus puteoserpentis (Logatchev)]SHE19834.1 hypothetical protein BPUTEOMOX_2848 [methanotrophic endosymbiont of Bathymodiolus puteoserpentis (Logatchev)]